MEEGTENTVSQNLTRKQIRWLLFAFLCFWSPAAQVFYVAIEPIISHYKEMVRFIILKV